MFGFTKLAFKGRDVSMNFKQQKFKVFTSVLAPSLTSFMLMAFLPLSLPFFLFFFLKIHFLQTQKQHANTRIMATKAIETMAHDGTVGGSKKAESVWI